MNRFCAVGTLFIFDVSSRYTLLCVKLVNGVRSSLIKSLSFWFGV